METMYCTIDNETFGGATNPKGSYHLGGCIHNKNGKVACCFNYLIAENYNQIIIDDYAKVNMDRYERMRIEGTATMIATEEEAVQMVESLLQRYNVKYVMAYNSAFDLTRTKCFKLIENREFIDLWLMATETIVQKKSYSIFCHINNLQSTSKKNCSTTAQTMYAYLTNNPEYIEEHTALEDSKIEMTIFVACLRMHKKFTKNKHFFDAKAYKLMPKW